VTGLTRACDTPQLALEGDPSCDQGSRCVRRITFRVAAVLPALASVGGGAEIARRRVGYEPFSDVAGPRNRLVRTHANSALAYELLPEARRNRNAHSGSTDSATAVGWSHRASRRGPGVSSCWKIRSRLPRCAPKRSDSVSSPI